jgi:Flp pilus assembly protein TadD
MIPQSPDGFAITAMQMKLRRSLEKGGSMNLKRSARSVQILAPVAILVALSQFSFGEPALGSLPVPQVESVAGAPSPMASAQLSTGQQQPGISSEELGDGLMAHKQYEAAIHAYKRVTPKSADVLNKTGIAYQMMFDNDDALRCYLEAAKLEPSNSNALNNIGTVYVSLKDLKSAERYYRKALKIDPKSAVLLKNIGSVMLARRKFEEGGKYYAAALKIDPNIFKPSETPTISNPSSEQEVGAVNYYMAIGCARAGMTSCAVDYLRMALNEGYTNPRKIAADSDFASIRGLPEFEQLMESQTQRAQ